jgi:hypothetical protein
MPAGVFIGNVLGDKADTGDPSDDALIPALMLGSYFGVGGSFVLDGSSFVATDFNGSGISLDPPNPSLTYLPKLDAKINESNNISKRWTFVSFIRDGLYLILYTYKKFYKK